MQGKEPQKKLFNYCIVLFIISLSSIASAQGFIQVSHYSGELEANASFSASLSINADSQALTGSGVRIHYNSGLVSPAELTLLQAAGFVGGNINSYADVSDYDADPTTNRYMVLSWASTEQTWLNSDVDIPLADIEFSVADLTEDAQLVLNTSAISATPGTSMQLLGDIEQLDGYIDPTMSISSQLLLSDNLTQGDGEQIVMALVLQSSGDGGELSSFTLNMPSQLVDLMSSAALYVDENQNGQVEMEELLPSNIQSLGGDQLSFSLAQPHTTIAGTQVYLITVTL